VQLDSIKDLTQSMRAKEVELLIMIGGNPVYNAPADLQFADLLAHVPFTLHHSLYEDETSAKCVWNLPRAHVFESWSDTRAGNGMASIVQPLIAPLHGGKTEHELLAALLGSPVASSHEIVREHWQRSWGYAAQDADFEQKWQVALHDGIVAGSAAETRTPTLVADFAAAVTQSVPSASGQSDLQLAFCPDPSVWDGRYADNAWLQELPRPFTKLTWDNAALISPRTADEHRVTTGDVVEIETVAGHMEMPVFVVPTHPRHTITVHLGYGHQSTGRVGTSVGTNVYPLRTTDAMSIATVKSVRKTGRTYPLSTTQHHHLMAGRDLVRSGTLAEFVASPEHPSFMHAGAHAGHNGSLYPEHVYEGNKWGLVVNQSNCIGCNACVIACQAENNIPVVGKTEVARGREMHWLRIDTYYGDDPANPAVYHQPVLCMHCENAPCEPVCPVAATSHSGEGLNEMTYNRCVGTRYCSNNCPYKVRRFNFFDYNSELRQDPTLQLLSNPDVTIRSRGVMEKCTYCVQRINEARIRAGLEHRPIRDGELVTACQAACPTEALTFGNLNDGQSVVSRLAGSSLNYSLLADLNTRPRTTYLAVVRNPNSKLAETETAFH
jgi:molybdopterin-containing oxidoreductase family iron-sulfur binding subunit